VDTGIAEVYLRPWWTVDGGGLRVFYSIYEICPTVYKKIPKSTLITNYITEM